MAEPRRKFDADFREGAVRLVREAGKPIAQVARDLGINEGTRATGLTQTGAGVAMAPARLPGIVEGVVLTPQLPERGEGQCHAHAHRLAIVELGVWRPGGVIDVGFVPVGQVRARGCSGRDE